MQYHTNSLKVQRAKVLATVRPGFGRGDASRPVDTAAVVGVPRIVLSPTVRVHIEMWYSRASKYVPQTENTEKNVRVSIIMLILIRPDTYFEAFWQIVDQYS